MTRRVLESLGVAALLLTALVMWPQASAVSVAGQSEATTETGPAPRTAWDHPDLEGIWLDEFNTPLERPAQYADREFLTEQEQAELDEGRRDPVGNNYSGLFTSVKPTARRTSLVVDPPNGRIPALTPQAQERNRLEQEFRMALLQHTETCRRQLGGATVGRTGRPRRASPKPPPSTTPCASTVTTAPRTWLLGSGVWEERRPTSTGSAASCRGRTTSRSVSTPGRDRGISALSI